MKVIVITLIAFIFILSILLLLGNKENFNQLMHYPGNVHIKGGVSVRNTPNKCKIAKNLCIVKDNEPVQCITGEQLSYLVNANNQQQKRLKMKCLNDTCISKQHLEILKGERDIQIKNKEEGTCYAYNDIGVHGNGGFRFDKNSWHTVHDSEENGSHSNGILPNVLIKADSCNNIGKNIRFEQRSMPPPIHVNENLTPVTVVQSPPSVPQDNAHIGQSPRFGPNLLD